MLDVGAVIDQFRAAMANQGIDVRGDIIADGILHRAHVEGDKRHHDTAWYILHADEHPNGTFGCWKRYARQKFTWSSKETTAQWTPEQRRAWHDQMEQKRLQREKEEAARHAAAAERGQAILEAGEDAQDNHPYLRRKGVKAHGIKVGRWEVANPQTGELTTVSNLALLIPIRDTRKKVWSVQAIFPHDRNALKRDKDYLKDGAKLGLFFTIGKIVNNIVLICEGYATGASLHEATGHAVAVAFDSSNLEPVANALRQVFPEHKIVLCADNDQWTLTPVENPGRHYAEAAAATMGGLVALPTFGNIESKPTDFNDLAQLEGLEVVRRNIEEILARPAEADEPLPWEGESEITTTAAPAAIEGELLPKDSHGTNGATPPADDEDDDGPVAPSADNAFFKVLGYDHGTYFIFQREKSQLMQYDRSQFSEAAFIELAEPSVFWQRYFKGGKKGSFDKAAATNFIMRTANERGIYDPDRVRGRGAWVDAGRVVYHHGDYLDVDGTRAEIGDGFKSRFIYERQRPLPELEAPALTDEEGDELVSLAGAFRWTKPASAALLCGWILLAPICGALRWRPHIWLTGGAGTGKSTILNDFVYPLLYEHNLFAQGNTTEAGLRQKLRSDALPVIFEESEQNEERDKQRIQNVLSLIRQASTESSARVYKGTVAGHSMEFLIRSMFCLASIQVGMKQQADLERVTILALRPKKEASSNSDWDALKEQMHKIVRQRPDIGARLVRRALLNVGMIRDNIRVFSAEATNHFGSAREGDQYGSLLAGNWSLFNSRVATPADAKGMIDSYSWEEHRDVADTNEGQEALGALMASRLKAPKGLEFSIHELAAAACGTPVQGVEIDRSDATTILRRYGMLVKDSHLFLSNGSVELREIMSRTNFSADWRGVLLRVPGADRYDNKTATFNGVASKCIRVPIPPPDGAMQKSWLTAESPVER